MPSYTDLRAEPEWIREYQPPSLALLCERLRESFGVTAAALGSKGDNNHLYGYHRSRAWILNSRYSVYGSGDYSVQAAADQQGDPNWLAAIDFTPGDVDTLIVVCQRLDAAVRAGQCPQLREWYGNVDGDQLVDGWDLLRGRAATSDSSHLWHLHLSFLRGRADDDHSNLYAILNGEDDDMDAEQNRRLYNLDRLNTALLNDFDDVTQIDPGGGAPYITLPLMVVRRQKQILAALTEGVEVTAKVDLTDEAIAKVADATADEIHADPERDGADG